MTAPGVLAAGYGLFTLVYFTLFALGAPQWLVDAILVLPAGVAAGLHFRRGTKETGRSRWFWRLTALGPSLWALGTALWALAEYRGFHPGASVTSSQPRGFPILLDVLFVGFYVPVACAVAMRPHPRAPRPDASVLAEIGLITTALAFLFLRVVFLPVIEPVERPWRLVFGLLGFVLAASSAAFWRWLEDPVWSRTYGVLALFAVLYVFLDSLATGFGNATATPGEPGDLAWILPFFVLGLAALPGPLRARAPTLSTRIILLAGTGPLLTEAALMVVSPYLGLVYQANLSLLVGSIAFLAIGCAVRLRLQQHGDALQLAGADGRAEEARRAGRLETLVSLTGSFVEELRTATGNVVAKARQAASFMGDKAERVLEQARRAETIVEELARSLRLVPTAPRQEVDLGQLLEETVRTALDEGLALRVSLEGTRRLPPIWGDPGALGSAFEHLIRNASQAFPGGHLRVRATPGEGRITVRFQDEGPGVPSTVRDRIFDPFFTTRPVGDGMGLGLTHVHFVLHDHGGSVVLEEGEPGACFALELPIRERRRGEAVQAPWPLVLAILASAAVAVSLVVSLQPSTRAFLSLACQIGSSLGASVALAYAGIKRAGRARMFWFLLAAGPAVVCLCGPVLAGKALDPPGLAVPLVVDLLWASALFLRPDRQAPSRVAPRSFLDGVAALALLVCLYSYFVVLPSPFAARDAFLAVQREALQGALRSAIAIWAAVLSWRAASNYWRGLFGRLALVLAGWAMGETMAGVFAARPAYAIGQLSDLGWIVPQVILAALALGESFRSGGEEAPGPRVNRVEWPRTALLVASAAALALFDALPVRSGQTALDAARHSLTLTGMALVGFLIAFSELVSRHPRFLRRASPALEASRSQADLEPSSRLLRAARTALYEVSGHLSGIRALARLVLAQSDTSARIRGDVESLKNRGETAIRIVHNLMSALPGPETTFQAFSVNRLVEEVSEMRGADLTREGIRFETRLAPEDPLSPIDPSALRHVLLSCVDQAGVALRGAGVAGAIELATAVEDDQVLVRIGYDGPGLPKSLVKQLEGLFPPLGGRLDPELALTLSQQALARQKGTLSARQRGEGGTELTLKVPRALTSS